MTSAETPTETTDILVPLDTDKQPIIWDGNDATMDGLLYEIGLYVVRKQLFRDLLAHRGKTLSNGRMAVQDYSTVQFLSLIHISEPTRPY